MEVTHFLESRKRYFKTASLSLAKQKLSLDLLYPDSRSTISNGKLEWYGKARPTAFSRQYDLRIEYKMGKIPEVWLLNARVDKMTDKKIPHNFKVDAEEDKILMCLFRTKYDEWSKQKSIAETIIPWAVEWLFFFEIWQVTGQWNGGGEHPK